MKVKSVIAGEYTAPPERGEGGRGGGGGMEGGRGREVERGSNVPTLMQHCSA